MSVEAWCDDGALPSSATDASAVRARWAAHAVGVYGILATVLGSGYVPDLMAATGLTGRAVELVVFAPVLACAARAPASALRRPPIPAAGALLLVLAASACWSSHGLDALAKLFGLVTSAMWCALFLRRRETLYTAAQVASALCVASVLCAVARVEGPGSLSNAVPVFALFAHLHRDEVEPRRVTIGGWLGRIGLYVTLVAAIVLSTFRAAALGSLAGLLLVSGRNPVARVAAVLLLVIAGVVAATAPAPEPHYGREVERSDLVARYQAIGSDRFSGRQDIWEGVLEDLRTEPGWLWYGQGIGDVDYYVGSVNREISCLSPRGERALHTHNLFLEVFLATGVLGLPALALLVLSIARVVRTSRVATGLAAVNLVLCLSTVPAGDVTGGSLCFGFMLALAAGPPRATAESPS